MKSAAYLLTQAPFVLGRIHTSHPQEGMCCQLWQHLRQHQATMEEMLMSERKEKRAALTEL